MLSEFAEKMGDTKSLDEIAEKMANLDDKAVVKAIIEKPVKKAKVKNK